MDRLAQENALLVQENAELQQQISKLQLEEKRLTGSLQHYRAWSATLQSRFQQSRYHSDALKPPRRIYVGSLPADITDVGLH